MDYTLTGMSVIEPNNDAQEAPLNLSTQSEIKNTDEGALIATADELEGLKEKSSSKKRKSHKSISGSHKKVKNANHTKTAAISLQA